MEDNRIVNNELHLSAKVILLFVGLRDLGYFCFSVVFLVVWFVVLLWRGGSVFSDL